MYNRIASAIAHARPFEHNAKCCCCHRPHLDVYVETRTPQTMDKPRPLCLDCFTTVNEPEDLWGITYGTMTKSGLSYRCHVRLDSKVDSNKLRGSMLDTKGVKWYLVDGGYMSPEYLSMHWQHKLPTIVKHAPNASLVVTLMKDGDIVDVRIIEWRTRDERKRFVKQDGVERFLDEVERAARNYRPAQRKLPEDIQ